ncbi:MAG: serine protease [Mycobacterium sp.]
MVIGENSQSWLRQMEAAGQRYTAAAAQRRQVEQQRQLAGSAIVDSEEQLTARCDRLLAGGQVPIRSLDSLATKERIIGLANQMQAVSFLARGVRAIAAVARISLSQNGREIPQGTGSLISPRLLLTNNHVLPDIATAQDAIIEFRAEVGIENTPAAPLRFRLDPGAFFVTDAHLDFTMVLVAPDGSGATPSEVVGGFNTLIPQQGKIVVGEPMNIAGHPMGRLKEISIRENRLDLQLDEFLHYSTDTEPGNSGSPVFNDQWEVVALHHSGVPRTDEQGRALRRDGAVWRSGDGDDAIDWVANEGVRISVILKHLAGLNLDAERQAILAELGPLTGTPVTPAPRQERVPAPPTVGGGDRHLVFLHGRGQEGRDPDQLRRTWAAGLNQGLTLAGLHTVDPADVCFPFYGDVLLQSTGTRESVRGDAHGDELFEQLVAETAGHLGMPTELESTDVAPQESPRGFGSVLLGKLHTQLSWIAARSGLDSFLIAQIFKDVASYLDNAGTRRRVLDTVTAALPTSGALVLVSHSLGTVVAMDLISQLPPALEVELLVTAGSPLGLDAVYTRLEVKGPHRPDRVRHWLNTWYAGDPVAIGCPLSRSWTGQLQEIAVENSKDRAHDIAEYLAHAAVAASISQRLPVPQLTR